jgi:hypothetical protein
MMNLFEGWWQPEQGESRSLWMDCSLSDGCCVNLSKYRTGWR